MSIQLISAILRSPWYIDHDFFIAHAPIVASLLNREFVSMPGSRLQEENSKIPYQIAASAASMAPGSIKRGYDYNNTEGEVYAVIPIKGVLLKNDQDDGCGYFVAGMSTLIQRIQEADEHPNVKGIVLHVDCPGGTADGTQAFADAVKNTKKPIVAFVDGMAASAAYFAVSSADYIIGINKSAMVGSVGTMISFQDEQPFFESLGVKFHDIVSDLSPDKNADYMAMKKGEYAGVKQGMLNPLTQMFQDHVLQNRPLIPSEAIKGKMHFAADAIKYHMMDETGPIEAAFRKIDELSAIKSAPQNIQFTSKPKTSMKDYPLLIAVLGVEALETSDEGTFLNEEMLSAIEQHLNTVQQAQADHNLAIQQGVSEAATLRTQLSDAQAQLGTAQTDLETANGTIAQRDVTIAQLTNAPGANTAGAASQSDANNEAVNDIIVACETLETNDAIAALRNAGF